LAVVNADISKKLADVQLHSSIATQLANCAAAASPTLSLGENLGVSINTGSIAICANSVAQITFANEIHDLQKQQAALGVDFQLNTFTQQFSDASFAMGGFARTLSDAFETVDTQLQKIEQQRQAAKRAIAKALYAKTFHSQFEDKVNAILLARFQTD